MFAIIPAVVMKDAALSMSARMLYGILTWRCNEAARCWPTNRALGEALGLSAKRVSVLLSLLEKRGHIEVEILRDPGTGQVRARYIYPLVKSGRGIPENREASPQAEGYPSPQNGGEPPPENAEKKRKEETKQEDPPKAPHGGAAPEGAKKRRWARSVPEWEPERFEGFWRFYPRHENRAAAVAEWDRLRPDEGLTDQIARALRRQRAAPDWQRGIGIPHACRWLKHQRWTDELPEPGGPPGQGGLPGPDAQGEEAPWVVL